MALRAYDGFDHYNSPTADLLARSGYLQWTFSTNGAFASPGFDGNGKYYRSNALAIGMLSSSWASNLATGFVGQRILIQPLRTTRIDFMDYTGSKTQFSVLLDSAACSVTIEDGTSGHGALATSNNNVFAVNTWFYLEVGFTVSNTGSVDVHVNGVSVVSYSGDVQQSTNSWANGHIYFSLTPIGPGEFNYFQLDDVYLCDNITGPGTFPCNNFLGDVLVFTAFPTANASVAWTPLANANYQEVNEHAMDSDTSYNSSPNPGDVDLFTFDPIPASLATILAVGVIGAFKKDSSGARSVAQHVVSGGSTGVGDEQVLNTSYYYHQDVFPVDPNTSGSWVLANANAITAGYSLVA